MIIIPNYAKANCPKSLCGLWSVDYQLLRNQGPHRFPNDNSLEIFRLIDIEDDNGQFVFLTEGEGRHVHYISLWLKTSAKEISSNLVAEASFSGSACIDSIYTCSFEDDVCINFNRSQAGSCIGSKKGFPVPDPKTTTRPFSRCRIAFLLI